MTKLRWWWWSTPPNQDVYELYIVQYILNDKGIEVARYYLQNDGWHQFRFYDQIAPFWALAGITAYDVLNEMFVTNGSDSTGEINRNKIVEELTKVLQELIVKSGMSIMHNTEGNDL